MGRGRLSDIKRATGGSNLCLTGCDISHPKTTTLHFSNVLKSAESSSHSSPSFPGRSQMLSPSEFGTAIMCMWGRRHQSAYVLRQALSHSAYFQTTCSHRKTQREVCVCREGGWRWDGRVIESFCYQRVVQLSTELLWGAAECTAATRWTTKTSGTYHCYSLLYSRRWRRRSKGHTKIRRWESS